MLSNNKTFLLSDFLCSITYEKIPSSIIEKAKEKILDALGIIMVGRESFESRCINTLLGNSFDLQREKGVKEWTKQSILRSVWVDATSALVWNAADTSPRTLAHCEAVVVPVALIVGKVTNSSGPDVITAVVAGYEAMERVARSVNNGDLRGHFKRGFHATATCGVFGSVAAAGKLLKLTNDQLFDALGIAASFASGIKATGNIAGKNTTFWYHAGKAAHDGLLAVYLSLEGFSGAESGLEGRDGFLRAYSDQTVGYDEDWLIRDLGKTFLIEQCETKLYSTAHTLRTAIDVLLDLRYKNQISPQEVIEVEIGVPKLFAYISENRGSHPDCFRKASASFPYVLAVALLDGMVLPDQFSPSKFEDLNIRKIADRIRVVVDPDVDREFNNGNWPSRVTVTLADGRKLKELRLNPRGSIALPCKREDIEKKLKALLARLLSPESISKLIEEAWRLEYVANINEITKYLEV